MSDLNTIGEVTNLKERVASQEDELTNGKTTYFGENITPKTQELLDLASSWEIEYVRFSDLVLPVKSIIYS